MVDQLMGHVQGRVLGLQPGGAAQGFIPVAATLQLQTTAHQHQLETPVVTAMNFKGTRHRFSPASVLACRIPLLALPWQRQENGSGAV